MTNKELSNIIESCGIELYLIHDSVTDDIKLGCVLVEFFKPKWYQFKIKKTISRCKSMIEVHKPVGIKFKYSWIG